MQFEKKLAFFTAPSLLGIKCANLISLNKTDYDLPIHLERFNRKTASKGLQLKILCTCQNRTLVLLYNETLLERQLSGEEQKAILQKYGYPETPSLESKLNRLAPRNRHISWLSYRRCHWFYGKQGGKLQALRLLESIRQC